MYLVSDSTGRRWIGFSYQLVSVFKFQLSKEFVFIRTTNQIDKIIEECKKRNSLILYTIVEISSLNILTKISKK